MLGAGKLVCLLSEVHLLELVVISSATVLVGISVLVL